MWLRAFLNEIKHLFSYLHGCIKKRLSIIAHAQIADSSVQTHLEESPLFLLRSVSPPPVATGVKRNPRRSPGSNVTCAPVTLFLYSLLSPFAIPTIGMETSAIMKSHLKFRLSSKLKLIVLVPKVFILVLFAAESSKEWFGAMFLYLGGEMQEISLPVSIGNFILVPASY
ncbi:hypothetical protein TNCT_274831 [Trichonephila clavata]|uniref:Uncharacterized protein n=1 Tax=Trichonephila clavata TaxID=2740835 RepID=A0A8X6L5N2_TRICU|nr:hypothetical protein TNCT_274831 [Trichonephila clavata]